MQALIQQLQALVFQLRIQLALQEQPQGMNNREKLFFAAQSFIGRDASPNDIAPDEYGCAESVNACHTSAFGFPIGGDVSTYRMYSKLKGNPLFVMVDSPLRGDIVIAPSGYGNGKLSAGHVCIAGDNGVLMSNNSDTGLFDTKYTMESFKNRYQQLGGYPIYVFRRV